MKVSIDTKLYAVMNSKTKELVSRYTGGFFWTRRGDAVNKLNEKMRNGSYELITCSLGVIESLSGDELKLQLKNEAEAKKKKEAEEKAIKILRDAEINRLKEQLKDLTGFNDVSVVKTFLINTVLVPDYKLKIESVITELQKLNYSKI